MSDDAWARAALALQLLQVDPFGLGGVVIRMRAGGPREAVLSALKRQGVVDKMPPTISDDQLFGGIDLSRTLNEGVLRQHRAYFHKKRRVMLPMAERCEPDLAAKLAGFLEDDANACLFCLDEGASAEECVPEVLESRLAFFIAPSTRVPDGWGVPTLGEVPAAAVLNGAQIARIVHLAADLGIENLRIATLAVRAAKAHARLHGRVQATDDDLNAAAALVFAHRATRLPDAQAAEDDPQGQIEETTESGSNTAQDDLVLPDEVLVEAVKAALPDGLLIAQDKKGQRSTGSAGAGAKRVAKRRGRPLPSRPGKLDGRSRIDVVATLRTAAPWQRLRQAAAGQIAIHPSDIRVKRYQERSERVLIFTVDASGSAALARLGEAKGAVEMLLADAYASRDHVALVSFRGDDADLLLPPTRSLVQTKRRLAALPGGGSTPLAAGLSEAGRVADQARSRGMHPMLVLLTDGRANVSLNGDIDRKQAGDDAQTIARTLHHSGMQGLVIDTGNRPSPALQSLSQTLGGPYIALPRADAHRLQSAVAGALR